MMKTTMMRIVLFLGLLVMTTGCFGPMNATARLKTWNREIENRWSGEGMYILLRIPYTGVYGLFALGDLLIFNSMQFWGFENPIDPPAPERAEHILELDKQRMGSGSDEEE